MYEDGTCPFENEHEPTEAARDGEECSPCSAWVGAREDARQMRVMAASLTEANAPTLTMYRRGLIATRLNAIADRIDGAPTDQAER
jgi:hypothetical protein